MKVILYFAIFTAPLGAHFLNFDFGPFQMSPFRMAIIFAFILFFIFGIWGKQNEIVVPGGANSYSVKLLIIWLLYAVISVIWVHDLSSWFKNIYFLTIGVLTSILFINYLKNVNDIKRAFFWLQFGIAIQATIGWYEILTRSYLFAGLRGRNYDYYVTGSQRIPIAMQGNPNDFATLMFAGVFIAYICAISSKHKHTKIISYFLLINYIALLLATTSRANILALIISMAFLLAVGGKKKMLIFLIVPFCFLIFPQSLEFVQDTLHFNFNSGTGSDVVRLGLIKNGLQFLGCTYGFGVGAGQIEYWMEHNSLYFTGRITNIHNWWMEILTGYGVGIFIAYIIFYCRLFFDCYKRFTLTDSKLHRGISLSICSLMAGFIISSVSSSSNIKSEWLWSFWALCIAYQGIPQPELRGISHGI